MELSDNIEDTPIIEYTPDTVDEYIVVVNLPDCLLYTSDAADE